MTTRSLLTCAAIAACAFTSSVPAADGPLPPRQERVRLAPHAASAKVEGSLEGDATVDYMVRAAAGQTLEIELDATHRMNDFNVLPPGSKDVAMYSSAMRGVRKYAGVLPADGDYAIRVYIGRAAARRHEGSDFRLTIALRGKPLPALPTTDDAMVAGTPFHATARIHCVPPFASAAAQCDAGVVRRGHDGTATVEVRGSGDLRRRILFVRGRPTASDAMDAMTFSRSGDVGVVTFESGERYEIPDVFLSGG